MIIFSFFQHMRVILGHDSTQPELYMYTDCTVNFIVARKREGWPNPHPRQTPASAATQWKYVDQHNAKGRHFIYIPKIEGKSIRVLRNTTASDLIEDSGNHSSVVGTLSIHGSGISHEVARVPSWHRALVVVALHLAETCENSVPF